MIASSPEIILDVLHLRNVLGGRVVHDDVSFSVKRGEIVAIIGGSGCGKTTLLRSILRLIVPTAGTIKVFGEDIATLSEGAFLKLQQRWSVMFQGAALFSALTVLENVMYVLNEYSGLSAQAQIEIAKIKILMSGLELEAANKYPAELSGGMKKRAAMARAIALDPELIFLDEPTTGLDPKSATGLDELILSMRDNLGLTFVMVTHDLDTLWRVPDRVIFLGDGNVLANAPMRDLFHNTHPLIRAYFSGQRAMRSQNGREG